MLYELRIYSFHAGQKKPFLRSFSKARRFMKKYGMTFVAAWENPDREDEFIWIRAYPSLKARQRSISAYYTSSEWLKIVGMIRPTIRRREVRILKALPYSKLR